MKRKEKVVAFPPGCISSSEPKASAPQYTSHIVGADGSRCRGVMRTCPSARNTRSESTSTGSSGSEGHGEECGTKREQRRQKNRDAARKSRKKQTQKADELHEELQHLELANTALEKEIAALRRELHFYTVTLKHHEPRCTLTSVSSLPTANSASTDHQNTSSSASPLLCSTSIALTDGGRTPDGVKSPFTLTSSVAPTTTNSEHFSVSSVPVSHSLLSKQLPLSPPSISPSLGHASVTSISVQLISNPVPSTVFTTLTPKSDETSTNKNSSLTANTTDSLSSSHSDVFAFNSITLGNFPEPSSIPASSQDVSNILPFYSPLVPSTAETVGLGADDCCMNALHLQSNQFNSTPVDSSPPYTLWTLNPQDTGLGTLSLTSQMGPNPSSGLAFALKPSYSQEITPNLPPLLSLLTTPSPLTDPLTTSTSFNGPPLMCGPSTDTSFSELLEDNDWILCGGGKP
ncbi:nuclear pore complex protein DDB_G0274915 isoform X2 [Thalassophryne amazonica]|uniref:nuclear pore complex protein DDB_G0274915 isoform X2 n=1 Tax=Thalassophryne amazonica TaxID=390379 RepID=UPI001471526A|nr:nuclear pore complex protein DDB_G0274915 isoform X2 [Thalassophryne amazonica]